MWWIWIPYAISLVLVVYVSNILAYCIDALESKGKMTGAFLSGVLLAGVTSLPELITSVTAALMGEPEMTMGNILGSNLFDIAIIGFLMVLFAKRVKNKPFSKGNIIINIFTLVIAVILLFAMIFDWQIVIPYVNINILTPLIVLLYVIAIIITTDKGNKKKNKDIEKVNDKSGVIVSIETRDNTIVMTEEREESKSPKNKYMAYSTKKIVSIFIICAVVLVGVSVAMTYMVDIISEEYNLAKGIAGALFLGVATSLPEIVSTFSLVRLGNLDAGYGNILGSCLFNFLVLAIADILYFSGTIFNVDLQNLILSACLVAAAMFALAFALIRNSKSKFKNLVTIQVGAAVLICFAYIVFLVLSVTII